MTVTAPADTTPPDAPTLTVENASPEGIELSWTAVGDADFYELLRADSAGGPYTEVGQTIAGSGTTTFTDTNVVEDTTYFYVVRAVDASFNRSANSNEVEAMAARRTVTVVFNVTVPATTDATGRDVNIVGTLARLDGGHPDWDPGATPMTRVNATLWTISLTGKEGTQLEYKYALEDWEHGEKGASCDELSNRTLTLDYGLTGTQTVNDTVLNWRNVAPCGN